MRTIGSQKFLDANIVEEKRANCDYAAQRVAIEIDGERLFVVVDGHHSIAAAKADGVPVEWETPRELQALAHSAVEAGAEAVQLWMAERQLDAEWYDIATGRDAW